MLADKLLYTGIKTGSTQHVRFGSLLQSSSPQTPHRSALELNLWQAGLCYLQAHSLSGAFLSHTWAFGVTPGLTPSAASFVQSWA